MFAPLIGQPQAVELLTQAIARNRIAPAYLLAGPMGVGRSLAAQCFVEALFAVYAATPQNRIRQRNHPDLLWVEPTYLHQGKRLTAAEAVAAGIKRKTALIRLEQVREISRFLSRAPLEAPRSVVVIEHAETMAEPVANALLKTLEEPGQATLILIAPSVDSLLPTLISRCQRIPFCRLSPEAMAQVLSQSGHSEVLQHADVLQLAQGSPGAAIAHWQQLQEIPPVLLQTATQRPRSYREALTLARQIDKTVAPENQLWLIDYLQQIHWQQCVEVDRGAEVDRLPLTLLEQAKEHLMRNVQPRLVWEVTLLGMMQPV
ncbi:AAA family ATPase [Leptolyngbya sp. FACHB-36]|uniref:DNA polymerase III subunit delta' n=1 Tax=Leptolyngbya sp. FACHB-36 TaxID=2692808 RepID=UPI00167FEB1A|nr:DNA polymerase III subunit delta' [Leptolyngbya sp. FACHB-36]MBD2019582.1 AAA family ATPase [Leptolyngbya sp. FACHB-36]